MTSIDRQVIDTEFSLTLQWIRASTVEERTRIINKLQQVLIMHGVTKQELDQRAKAIEEEIKKADKNNQ